ncbi:MAG TPA: hypothetical protein VGW35_03370 [Methylomirabilota bacterium]|nr:hypothetical protein [Methylomirabilota bacterium]
MGASRPERLPATLAGPQMSLDAEERAELDEVWYRLPRVRPGSGLVR